MARKLTCVGHHTGDNDPIDVVEIGGRSWSTGSIVEVKVLGVLALIGRSCNLRAAMRGWCCAHGAGPMFLRFG